MWHSFFSVQGLTLDIDRGNLLRLGKDGIILAASHGTRKMSDIEIEKTYGRGRKKHIASEYAAHLHVSLCCHYVMTALNSSGIFDHSRKCKKGEIFYCQRYFLLIHDGLHASASENLKKFRGHAVISGISIYEFIFTFSHFFPATFH